MGEKLRSPPKKKFQNNIIGLGLEFIFSLSFFRLNCTKKVFDLDAQESMFKSIECGNKDIIR